MKTITHKNLPEYDARLAAEPYFQPGPQSATRPDWIDQPVTLEVPLGELAIDPIHTALLTHPPVFGPRPDIATAPITGQEGFAAQGLEGKARIPLTLFQAILSLRECPLYRGRILFDR